MKNSFETLAIITKRWEIKERETENIYENIFKERVPHGKANDYNL